MGIGFSWISHQFRILFPKKKRLKKTSSTWGTHSKSAIFFALTWSLASIGTGVVPGLTRSGPGAAHPHPAQHQPRHCHGEMPGAAPGGRISCWSRFEVMIFSILKLCFPQTNILQRRIYNIYIYIIYLLLSIIIIKYLTMFNYIIY